MLNINSHITFQDAYILASLLSKGLHSKDTLNKIAEIYSTICCPAGNNLIEKSRRAGRILQMVTPDYKDAAEGNALIPPEKLVEFFAQYDKELEMFGKGRAEEDKNRALEMLVNS